MIDIFTWKPLVDATGTSTFSTRTAQFGNGYRQVAANGINSESQSWPLTFQEKEALMLPIAAFLRAHAGHRPFYWTPPLGTQSLWTCAEFSIKESGGGLFTIAATFEQYFGVE